MIRFLLWPADRTASSLEALAARVELDNASYHIAVSSQAMIQLSGYLKRSRKDWHKQKIEESSRFNRLAVSDTQLLIVVKQVHYDQETWSSSLQMQQIVLHRQYLFLLTDSDKFLELYLVTFFG